MRVVITGGGSGGHIKPLISVGRELKRQDEASSIIYMGAKGDRFVDLIKHESFIEEYHLFSGGKFRRFSTISDRSLAWLQKLKTSLMNLTDLLKVIFGLFQAARALHATKPDVIFSKGGFPAVPVVLAARVLRIPLITHDSDAIAGLANKITRGWADLHLVSSRDGDYPYKASNIEYVGVPLAREFYEQSLTPKQSRRSLQIDSNRPVVAVIGGSLGAEVINEAILATVPQLTKSHHVIHITGEKYFSAHKQRINSLKSDNYRPLSFVTDGQYYFDVLNAADIVISRAGATSLAEVLSLKKKSIIIPAPQLADQVKNAETVSSEGVAVIVHQDDIEGLMDVVTTLSDTKSSPAKDVSRSLKQLETQNSTERIANFVQDVASNHLKHKEV